MLSREGDVGAWVLLCRPRPAQISYRIFLAWHILSFFFKNAVCFIILTYLVPVLFTFNLQGVLKLKKIIPAPKR